MGALEGSLQSELGAARQVAAASMRELHNSVMALMERSQQQHASAKRKWQQQQKELQEQLHAAQQQVQVVQLERTAAEALTVVWRTRHAESVRQAVSPNS